MSDEKRKCVLSLFIGGTMLSANDNMFGEY